MEKKKKMAVRIRPLTRYQDFKRLIDIQRRVWRHDDLDLTPTHQFCITSRMGAIILGAFYGRELVGFVYSFPVVFEKKLGQHSHLLAVLPEYQGYGIGKRLKWAQRDFAQKLGYRRITWTFDPLQAKNANLNLRSLRAVTRTYLRNFYGMDSELNLGPGIPTDRLLVEWPIGEKRAAKRRPKNASAFDPTSAPQALAAIMRANESLPGRVRLGLRAKSILAEVPCDINAWRPRPDLIAAWQKSLRRVFEHYFGLGYAAVDFISGDRCFYVLTREK
ncbi:MAG: GNAT family N-acetyltransferase [Acidobacteriota bacterium]